ncbi:cytochrome P450 [Jatrophihabitans sp.]|uniref:cytochrome P450 n=1 Tax=Jatrophihabitans sp. TaxID=1932789 RepID=UPI0030C6C8A2|nr:cytochrome [Jatrophihabitans sp.]
MSTMQERAAQAGLNTRVVDLEGDARLGVDPFAVWDELADDGPLLYSTAGRGFFVATDYDTIKDVLQDPAKWSSLPTSLTYTTHEVINSFIPIAMDPPEHGRYRSPLIPLFGPRAVKRFDPHIRQVANDLIDKILAKGTCDYVIDFASQLPAQFFLAWLGLGEEDAHHMHELANRATFGFEDQSARTSVEDDIGSVVRRLLEERRDAPRDDLASELLALRIDGEPIDMESLVSIGSLAFVAGQDTTAGNLAYTMLHLSTHAEDRRRIVDDPGIIPLALEELTRLYNSGGPVGRIATQDMELHGTAIEPGDRIFLARVTADRSVYDDGVKLDRQPNRHTAFGLGPHRCLGVHIARLEMQIALEVWHQRLPNYRVPPGFVPEHRYGSFMQQLKSLPLEFDLEFHDKEAAS